jgi:hypothetical protein
VDLPGAARLADGLFQGAVWFLDGLGTLGEAPLVILGVLWLGVAAASRGRPRIGEALWTGTATLGVVAIVGMVAVAALMERALAAGFATSALCVWATGGLRFADAEPGPSRTLAIVGFLAGAVALYYPYALVRSVPEGYLLLRLGAALARQGVSPLTLFAAVAGGAGVVALGLLVRSRGMRPVAHLGACGLAGVIAAVAAAALLGESTSVGTILGVLASGLAIGAWVTVRDSSGGPRSWLIRGLPAVTVALLLFGHTYTARVFSCPSERPGLEAVATLPEVFRVELNEDASAALLSVRPKNGLALMDLRGDPGALRWVSGGDQPHDGAGLPDTPEDLAFAPGHGFYAVHSPRDESTYDGVELEVPIRSVLVSLAGDPLEVVRRIPFPGLCWTSAAEWSPTTGRLYLGCEKPAGLHRWDPTTGELEVAPSGSVSGDVESLAVDPDPAADRVFTVALWRSGWLTELVESDLSLRRRAFVGSGNYVVVYDSDTDRLFVSSYYRSRVTIVDASSLQVVGSIPTGLGTRALALDRSRGLLLVASTYDGVLRVVDTATGQVRERIHVGGHVKDIAVDEARGQAWFWSQCALYRLDLNGIG